MTAAGFVSVTDPAAYVTAGRAAGKLVVWVPYVRSKRQLLGILAQGLRFPDYFGWNWDALEECLQDLSWLPERAQVAIVHERIPFGEGDHRQTYVDILKAATQERSDGRLIEVVVPAREQTAGCDST